MQCEVKKQDQTGPAAQKRESRKVADRQLIGSWQIEFSAHRVTAAMLEDSKLTFQHEIDEELERLGIPAAEKKKYLLENLLAVPTWQPAPRWEQIEKGDWASAELDLSLYPNQEVNKVRKQLYNKVVAFVNELRPKLKAKGAWLDAACPITGNSMCGPRTSHVYNELEGLTMMLGYDSIPIGCCGIVLHPDWQKAAYPVTLFTLAPYDLFLQVIAEVANEPKLPDIDDQAAKDLVDGDSCM